MAQQVSVYFYLPWVNRHQCIPTCHGPTGECIPTCKGPAGECICPSQARITVTVYLPVQPADAKSTASFHKILEYKLSLIILQVCKKNCYCDCFEENPATFEDKTPTHAAGPNKPQNNDNSELIPCSNDKIKEKN